MLKPQASLFSQCAREYSKYRPTYSAEVTNAIFDKFKLARGDLICDLGAGAGALSFLMASAGARVIAVEPLEEMLGVLARKVRSSIVPILPCRGTAENIPLIDRSVRAVTCGQAFHWFDATLAFQEIHRILERHGGLALVWNFRDWEHVSWLRKLELLLLKFNPRYESEFKMKSWKKALSDTRLFDPIERFENFQNRHLSKRSVIELIKTFSYVRILPARVCSQLEKRVNILLDDEMKRKGKKKILVRYRSELYLTFKRD